MKYCQNCGNKLHEDDSSCQHCGVPVVNYVPVAKSSNSFYKLFFVLVILGVLIIIVLPRIWMLAFILEGTPFEAVIQKPQVYLAPTDVNVNNLGLSGMEITLYLSVINPNFFPMTLDRATFDLYMGNTYLANGEFDKTTIPGHYTKRVPTDVYISSGGVLKSVWNTLTGGATNIRIDGKAYFGSFSIPFSVSETTARQTQNIAPTTPYPRQTTPPVTSPPRKSRLSPTSDAATSVMSSKIAASIAQMQ